MELKFGMQKKKQKENFCSNRTFMELKLHNSGLTLNGSRF